MFMMIGNPALTYKYQHSPRKTGDETHLRHQQRAALAVYTQKSDRSNCADSATHNRTPKPSCAL